MTITLQDDAHILSLRVTGEVVSGCSISKDDATELCNRLLGKQSVIKRVVRVIRPLLYRSDNVGIQGALGDLQNLANIDIDALDVDNEENREHVRSSSTPTIQHVYVSKTRAGGRDAGEGKEETSRGLGGRVLT
ncbi:hypothetical protein HHK36_021821 [Tetracentron sinense]|uniref:Uncharacterized protein n=1 Tax=Tetracentron sinense TaxID=13715 RepID=A0A834YXP0_TETSI|nr:hypothetical protein HHK36_021821 [Tetracentron sinense]